MRSTPRALLVTPEVPAPSGNGLAMRAGAVLQGLAEVARVTLVVVRSPGQATAPARVRAWVEARADHVVEHQLAPADDRAVAASWLADPETRARLAALEPLSASGRGAHPVAVSGLVDELDRLAEGPGPTFDVVVAERLRTAPWVEPYLATARLAVLDLDDDEVAAHRRLARAARWRGELELGDDLDAEGAALARLADWYLPRFDVVTVASALDVDPVARLGATAVEHLPNAVALSVAPDWSAGSTSVDAPPGRSSGAVEPVDPPRPPVRLLFVGNLTYAPNRWAAVDLVRAIQPALADRLDRPIEVTLVGAAPGSVRALADRAGVVVTGALDALDAAYAAADLVVVPLVAAGGTRLKVLEAFARGVPVVATAAAVEGLGVEDGVHARVVADAEPLDVDGLVSASAACVDDPPAAAARARAARALVADRFTVAGVTTEWAARLRSRLGAD